MLIGEGTLEAINDAAEEANEIIADYNRRVVVWRAGALEPRRRSRRR
jgi:hypothetical protein